MPDGSILQPHEYLTPRSAYYHGCTIWLLCQFFSFYLNFVRKLFVLFFKLYHNVTGVFLPQLELDTWLVHYMECPYRNIRRHVPEQGRLYLDLVPFLFIPTQRLSSFCMS